MASAVLIITLLTLAASLASWLFSQWLASRQQPVRLGDHGPLVAPIFTIRDAGNAQRQIRYLACEVTAPGVLQALHESGGDLTQQQLTAELRADTCYAQVLAWSSSGQRSGASPDSLLRNGID